MGQLDQEKEIQRTTRSTYYLLSAIHMFNVKSNPHQTRQNIVTRHYGNFLIALRCLSHDYFLSILFYCSKYKR